MPQWIWPLPNCVPFEAPKMEGPGRCVRILAPLGTLVHSVEDGVICDADWRGSFHVLGASGKLQYSRVMREDGLVAGSEVKQGQVIGIVQGFGAAVDLSLYEYTEDLGNLLRGAWSHVCHRFHRDVPAIPTTPSERRQMVQDLMKHPLWFYPTTHKSPPSGNFEDHFKTPDDPESAAKGYMQMVDPGPDWIETVDDCGGGSMQECLDFDFVYVDPTLDRIRGDWNGGDPRDTEFRVWIEGGGWMDCATAPYMTEPEGGWKDHNRWHACHDMDLDCGGSTMEEALLNLAQRVQWYYGDTGREHRPDVPEQCDGHFEGKHEETYVSHCDGADDGFCKKCGYLIRHKWNKD